MPQKLYSTSEAAQELGYTNDAYIRRMIREKRLKPVGKIGKTWVIAEAEIERVKVERNRKVPILQKARQGALRWMKEMEGKS